MSDFDAAVDRVLQCLAQRGVSARLVGAAALAAHGVSRSTRDVDLLVASPSILDSEVWVGVALPGFELTVHRGDPTDPLDGVVRLETVPSDDAGWDDPVEQLDIIVLRALWATAMMQRSGPSVPLGSGEVQAVDAADLVLLKLYAGGPKDRWDVLSLLEAVADRDVLVAEVDARVGQLRPPFQALWARLRDEV